MRAAAGKGLQVGRDPELMATAMRTGVQAGRAAFRAGRIPRRWHAEASTPFHGMPDL